MQSRTILFTDEGCAAELTCSKVSDLVAELDHLCRIARASKDAAA